MTRCTNFIDASFTPAFTPGDQSNSMIRVLHVDKVFHGTGLLRYVHLKRVE
jgi:hypothetical protein